MDARTSTEIAVYDVRRQAELEKGERRKKKIREDLNYLAVHRLDLLKAGAYSPEALVSEENKLRSELSLLQENEVHSDEEMKKALEDLEKLSELVNNLDVVYKNATPSEKEAIIKEMFSELKVNGETLEYQCTRGFQPLAHHFVALGDLERDIPRIWDRLLDILTHLNTQGQLPDLKSLFGCSDNHTENGSSP